MWSSRAIVAFLVIGCAFGAQPEVPALDAETMKKAGELALALHKKVHQLNPNLRKMMAQQRRLDQHMDLGPACWDDCPGAANASTDTNTVCKFPDRCSSMPIADSCIADCTRKVEVMLMCETKQFCVDAGGEGACPTTLGLIQGAADNPDAVACPACTEFSGEFTGVMTMSGFGTYDMDVSKMTMGMITEDMCPKTVAAGECALANADCLDPTKSTDGGMLLFTALCECPCGKKLAKFLWDIDSMMFSACAEGVKDGFSKALPGMAEMGPILFSSGILECFGCKWNADACTAAFTKWILDPGMQGTMMGIMTMAGKCDEVTTAPPTTAAPTTTEAPAPAASSARGLSYVLGCIVAVFAAVQLA